MKVLKSFFLLFTLFLSIVAPPLQIYAEQKDVLEAKIEASVEVLDKIGEVADTKLESVEKKEKDSEQRERINEKQEEIQDYIEEVKENLVEDVSSLGELKEKLGEVKKVVTLKIVSGVTNYESIEEGLPKEILQNEGKRESALEVLQDSLTTKESISLFVRSTYQSEKVKNLLQPYDTRLRLDFLYEIEGLNTFELFINPDSLLAREMLGDLKQGKIPESLLGIELIEPEVLSIGTEEQGEKGKTEINFAGEDFSQTWGIQKYDPKSYLSLLPKNSIQVAVIDTGVDSNHPDLQSNTISGYDFVNDDSDPKDDQGHGTHVAGSIGAALNRSGIIGVNPYANIVPLKICNDKGFCANYAILRALDYVKEHNISVVNMSLGGRGDPSTNPVCQSISSLAEKGSIVVVAAGNSNVDTSTFVPGGCRDAITVAAVDSSLSRASFSNYGSKVDVSAPGVGIYSAAIGGTYKKLSGTSMASPHIAGLVSLLKSKNPSIRTSEIKELFKNKQIPVVSQAGKTIAGFVTPKELLETTSSPTLPQIAPEGERGEEVKKLELASNQALSNQKTEGDGIRIVPSVPDTSSYEAKSQEVEAKNKELLENAENNSQTSVQSISDKVLDFFNLGDKTVINSDESIEKVAETLISEKVEPVKTNILQGDQYFGSDGKALDSQTIQNVEEVEDYVKGPLRLVDLQDTTQNTLGQTGDFDIPTPKTVELLIDGAIPESQVMNADGSIEGEEKNFDVYSAATGSTDQLNNASSFQYIETPVEKIEYNYDYPKEVFVDGVEKPLEINSVEEEQAFEPVEVKETNWYEEQLKRDELDPDVADLKPVILSEVNEEVAIQNIVPVVPINIFEGQAWNYNSYYYSYARDYQYSFSDPSIATMFVTKHYLYFTPLKKGKTLISMYSGTTLIQIIELEVIAPPEPQYYDVYVEEWKETKFYLPYNPNYRFSNITRTTNARADVTVRHNYNLNSEYSIKGVVWGEEKYFIANERGINLYVLNVKILPKPPIIKEYSVIEGRFVSTDVQYIWNQVYSHSTAGIVTTGYDGWRKVGFQGLKPGYTEVFMRDINSGTNYLFKVTVLPKPVPKVYELTLNPYGSAQIVLPEAIANYTLQIDPNNTLSDGGRYLVSGPNTFNISVRGNSVFNIYLKDTNYFERYIVKVKVVPYESFLELNQTDAHSIGYSSYNIYSTNSNVVRGGTTLYAVNPGTADIHLVRDGIHRQTIHVTVKPIPAPQELYYETLVQNRLSFGIQGGITQVQESTPGMYEIEYGTSTFRIRPIKGGLLKIWIKSHKGSYTSQIVTIRSSSLPPVVLDCSVPLGYNCISYDYMDTNQGYTFGVTNPSLQDVVLESFSAGSRSYYRYVIRSRTQGSGEVYIYRNAEHVATIKTTISSPVTPLSLQGQLKTIKEGEQLTLKVQGGAAPYKRGNYDSTALSYSLNETTGDIQIAAKQKPGSHTVEIKDKYDQTIKFGVTVLDAFLKVSQNQLTLQAGDNTTISIDDYYVALEPITKTNDNITLQLVDEANPNQANKPRKYLQIFAKTSGTTSITLKDAEGTIVVVGVTVTGLSQNEPQVSGNLLKNGKMNGIGAYQGPGSTWLGTGINDGWWVTVVGSGNAGLIDGRMKLETTGNNSFLEARTTNAGYFGVTPESTLVEPNTEYTLSYEYQTEYISGDSDRGFNVVILTSQSSLVSAGEFIAQSYIKITKGKTLVNYTFKTSATAKYLNISPLIYGHTGLGTLKMKAWVDNMVLTKKDIPPSTSPNAIRYIRDWAKGSNRNDGSHWIEIQAIDSNGINIALGKTVSSPLPNQPGYEYSKVVDGNTTGSSYAESTWGTKNDYVVVDLGQNYDISQVKVWHYYPDGGTGRIYNGTKTEVSSDGVNWRTIFDSAVSGTYVETVEGRSYSVFNTTDEQIIEDTQVTLDFPEILNITHTPQIEEGSVGGMMFHAIGQVQEVGIEFENAIGIQDKEILTLQPDGFYVVAFSEEICGGKCNNFQPYIIDLTGNKIYSSFQTKANVSYITRFSTASNEESQGDTSIQGSYKDFQEGLINICSVIKCKEQAQVTKKKLIDVKEKYGEIGSQVASMIPIVGEGYDILTLLLGKDPITQEELGPLGKTMTLVGLVGGATSGAGARKFVDEGLEKLASSLGTSVEEIKSVALEVAKEYKINTLDDIVKLKEELSLTKFLKKVKKKFIFKKVSAKIDHITKIVFQTNSDGTLKFTGVHSKIAINNHPYGARIELDTVNQTRKAENKAYNAKVFAKNANGDEILKTGKINGVEGISTFFPDNWSKSRIVDEVTYAVQNSKGKYTGPGAGPNEYYGFSKDGAMQINYFLDTNGGIISYFPKIN